MRTQRRALPIAMQDHNDRKYRDLKLALEVSVNDRALEGESVTYLDLAVKLSPCVSSIASYTEHFIHIDFVSVVQITTEVCPQQS